MRKQFDILIDFDGTCVTHEFPHVGKDIGAVPVLKALVEAGHRLILFTMRSDIKFPHSKEPGIHNVGGDYLSHAVAWFAENDIPLYGIQTNPTQKSWTHSPKAYGHLMIDDSALGTPLYRKSNISEKPFVNWNKVGQMLYEMGLIRANCHVCAGGGCGWCGGKGKLFAG